MAIEQFPRSFILSARPVRRDIAPPRRRAAKPAVKFRRFLPAQSVPASEPCAQCGRIDRATALPLTDAGYMPIDRYIEIFDDRIVWPPATVTNFGEGEI
jgi:hypothetical protein